MRHDRQPITADRDLALIGLLAGLLGALVLAGAVLMTAAATATALRGGPWRMPDVDRWVAGTIGALADPAHPAADLGPPWSSTVADAAGLYWTITVVVALAVTGVVTAIAWPVVRRCGPSRPGHATRADIRRELSPAAARRAAAWTRPSLTAKHRRTIAVNEVAVPCHRGPQGQPMCTTLENPTGVIAPTRSGKSRTDLVHKALAAPGAMLCSSTKPDLFEFTALARTRAHDAGPVLVADATGAVSWPAQARWSPVADCHDMEVARRRADTLVEASAVGLARLVGGNDKIFRERAKSVLQAYLLAATLQAGDIGHLINWAITKPPDSEPVDTLRAHGYTELADNLSSEIGMVAETSDAVWMSVRRVIEPFMEPRLRQLATPRPGDGFHARDFVTRRGTLYLIAGEHQAPQARPILTALAEHVLTTAQDMALEQPHRRLDPPLTAVLDELYDATPIPRLPAIVADSAGRGVIDHWAAQSWAQLEDLYDTAGQRQLLDNTLTLTLFGGLKDAKTLEWASTIAGQHERRRYQHYADGLFAPGRSAIGTETVPTYRPGAIRTLRRGRVLLIHRDLPPILARTTDVTRRPDWKSIRADIDTIRTGQIPVSATGYALTTGPGHPLGPA